MTAGELKRWLKKNGCRMVRSGKRHEVWISTVNNHQFTVGRHDKQEVGSGLLEAIKKEAGLK